MNLKFAIIISLLAHVLILSVPLILSLDNKKNYIVSVKKGIQSIDVSLQNNNKKEVEKENLKKRNDKYTLLVSPNGNFFVNSNDKDKKQKIKNIEKSFKSSKIGTLSKKVLSNLQNNPPKYPRRAIKLGLQGIVKLSIEVMPDGTTRNIKIKKSSGSNLLDRSAVKAAKSWIIFKQNEFEIKKPIYIDQVIQFVL